MSREPGPRGDAYPAVSFPVERNRRNSGPQNCIRLHQFARAPRTRALRRRRRPNADDFDRLREHLASVTTLMDIAPNWKWFMQKLDQRHPRYGRTMLLPFRSEFGDGEA